MRWIEFDTALSAAARAGVATLSPRWGLGGGAPDNLDDTTVIFQAKDTALGPENDVAFADKGWGGNWAAFSIRPHETLTPFQDQQGWGMPLGGGNDKV